LDAASTTGQAFGFRVKNPKNVDWRYSIAAGVFSETLDYKRGGNRRPSFSFRPCSTCFSDKGAARSQEMEQGGADAEK
jgi:hypothetical protein